MSDRQYTEEEVQDLTDRVFLLKQRLEEGKIHFADHLAEGFRHSFEAIRLRSDGLVDPETVDGRIRSATLAIRHFQYRNDAKEAISTGEIQDAYFSMLFTQFGWMMELMLRHGLTPNEASQAVARDTEFVSRLRDGLLGLSGHVKEFWESAAESGAFHLQDSPQLKATFSGDLFPAHWNNPVSTAGLYVDTIVLPCPILRIAPLLGLYPDSEVARLLTKHVLNAMTYRDIATADVAPPIALILPHPDDIQRGENSDLVSRATPAALRHGSYLFGRDFSNLDHYQDFCGSLRSVEQVLAELKRPDRILFDTDWEPGAEAQLTRVMHEAQPLIPGFDPTIAGNHVLGASMGRMPQALAAQDTARYFGGTPLISAPTSWQYYTWFVEYEAMGVGSDTKSTHVTRALTTESNTNLSWLGKVPLQTVLQIRKNGQAEELRNILSTGLDELIALRPDNYHRTSDQVVENLNRAFAAHQRQLLEARTKKLKLYGLDVGSFVATGAVAVTAALTSSPALGAASGLLGMVGLPNLKDLRSKFKELAASEDARKNSVTGLLFRHVK